jgi:hypothetical protein
VLWHGKQRMFEHIRDKEIPDYEDDLFPKFLNPGWKLANQLLSKKWFNMTVVLAVVFRVWVEKQSYAAHHCSRVRTPGDLTTEAASSLPSYGF